MCDRGSNTRSLTYYQIAIGHKQGRVILPMDVLESVVKAKSEGSSSKIDDEEREKQPMLEAALLGWTNILGRVVDEGDLRGTWKSSTEGGM